ncbi:MAG: ABC transporter ATP-binding protein [Kiritimatiellaeota bacterium]|nr:ABC transporter ATP-binding protein [Kiritimatiellota bacterium]
MKRDLSVFRRLLGYTRPHLGRLIVGILAGFITGGSLFGILRSAPYLIQPFEKAAATRPAARRTTERGPSATAPAPRRDAKGKLDGIAERIAARLHVAATDADGRLTWQFMLLMALGFPFFYLIKSGALFVNRYFMRWVGARVVMDLRNELFEHLQQQSLAFFGRRDVGDLISRCTNDAMLVETAVSGTIADLSRAPVEILASITFVVIYARENGMLGPVGLLLLAFPLSVVPIIVLGRLVKKFTLRSLRRISGVVTRMQENFTGIRVVKAFHTEKAEAERFRSMNAKYFREVIHALRAQLLMTPLMEFAGAVAAVLFLVFCYTRRIQMSQFIPMGFAAMTAYRPMKQLARIQASVQRAGAAAERIFSLLDLHTALPEAATPVRVSEFKDRIVFDCVSFRYDPESADVVRGLCFEMPRGTVTAFVGETGAGKTTVANLLARFYDPTDGRVLLDGLDLREIETASLRRLIGVVTQETILFNDTIANNIAYGSPEATREQIEKAAAEANAHDFIVADPEGYDRVVGEKGFRLSGGERQRIALARAILRDPPILILDEATSSLDTVTERLVQEAINRVMEHRTVFAIAHRLSTIKHADRIFLLDGGRIVEQGTHAELYAAGGRYRHLCDMQFS